MKKRYVLQTSFLLLIGALSLALFSGCNQASTVVPNKSISEVTPRLDIGLEALLENADFNTTITPRSHGYTAKVKGKGVIPGGEYAGHRFQITMEGFYTDIASNSLESGTATVKIRSERFNAVEDPLLQSFCCGEGDLLLIDGEWIFTMYGQVEHSSADEPHNHLFAGLARSSGTMNMNIADQTGTIVIPIDPPHDPGIGLIEEFRAQKVQVDEH